MNIVIDSNVYISAFATRGFCHELMEICIENYSIFISDYIINELKNKFKNKIKLPPSLINEIINYIKKESINVNPIKINDNICRDKKDKDIIGTALSAKAEIILTGDLDLLEIKTYKKIKIYSPRQFWEHLKK